MIPDELPVPENIQLALYRLLGEGWDNSADAVYAYIDAQAKQIAELRSELTGNSPNTAVFIATLKAALIKERIGFLTHIEEDSRKLVAVEQLAHEMPEIDWGEMSIEPNRYAPSEIRRVLGSLVAEIKRLRGEMHRLLRTITEHATISHQQLAAKDVEIRKWQEIIITSRAARIEESSRFQDIEGESAADRMGRARKQAIEEMGIQIGEQE